MRLHQSPQHVKDRLKIGGNAMAKVLTAKMEEEIDRCKQYMLSVLADQKNGMQKRVLAGTAVACGYATWAVEEVTIAQHK